MKVFTEDWLATIQHAFESNPSSERREVHNFMISNYWGLYRNEIEDQLGELDINSQRKLIKKLHSYTMHLWQILDVLNEISIGHKLVQLGYELEYEKEFNGLTPDWYVFRRKGDSPFLIEVSTKEYPFNDTQRHLESLRIEICNIQVSVELFLSTEITKLKLDSSDLPIILDEISIHLSKPILISGSSFSIRGITFEVTATHTGHPYVKIPFWSFGGFSVPAGLLMGKIMQKAEKYGPLKLPLTIALIVDPRTAYGPEELKDLLWGQEAYPIDDNLPFRLNDGLARNVPALSCVVMLKDSKLLIFENLYADYKLPSNAWE